MGGSPYSGVENHNMLKHLDQGLRLEQPCLCSTEMCELSKLVYVSLCLTLISLNLHSFLLIQKCWHEDPQHRPTFDQLVSDLVVVIQNS